jgi:hypothetical protein
MTPTHIVNPGGGQGPCDVTRVIDGGQASGCGIGQAGLQLQLRQQGGEGEAGQSNGQDKTANATRDHLPRVQVGS